MEITRTANPHQVISYGAGVNSTAMAIMLINQGWQGQIVFCDTGCEWPETYCFIDYFEREWLKPRGFEVVRLRGLPYQRNHGGASLIDYCEERKVIPMAAVRWCTMEYKVHPLARWCIDNGNPEQLIGIAADEAHRKPSANRPLVDTNVDREGCRQIILGAGLDIPRKSGCYICPFQTNNGWRELWRIHPDLFERAVKLEESCSRDNIGRHTATLDPAGKTTLRQRQRAFEQQIPMFDDTDWDDLLRFRPCICELGDITEEEDK